jgi:hypothetical protein
MLFGNVKRSKKYQTRDENEAREVDHILKFFKGYETVTTSMIVQACWEKAGFPYQQRDGTFYLVVREGRIWTAPDFQEIWERDYPIGSLAARRRSQKWGWLNRGFFRVKYMKQLKVQSF